MIILDKNGVGWSTNPTSKQGIIYKDSGIIVKKGQYMLCELEYWTNRGCLENSHRVNLKLIKKCSISNNCILQAKNTMIFPDYGSLGILMVSDHFMD